MLGGGRVLHHAAAPSAGIEQRAAQQGAQVVRVERAVRTRARREQKRHQRSVMPVKVACER